MLFLIHAFRGEGSKRFLPAELEAEIQRGGQACQLESSKDWRGNPEHHLILDRERSTAKLGLDAEGRVESALIDMAKTAEGVELGTRFAEMLEKMGWSVSRA